MAWRRHTRNLTHEVFYDGTTIDGSRLEKALGEVTEGINNVKKGNTKQRFVATQYHAGFNPADRSSTNYSRWPWLQVKNDDIQGASPESAPFNIMRFKGTAIPGLENFNSAIGGDQYAWTRMFHFSRPAILYGVSVMMHNDGGANAARPYPGTYDPAVAPAYTYNNAAVPTSAPPSGYSTSSSTVDVPIVLDVMNPGTPEDAVMTDVEYTRTAWVLNEESSSLIEPDSTATGWNDFSPHYDSGDITDVRPLYGRIVEHRDLNIPLHQRSRVRIAVSIPLYDGAVYTRGSWGAVPWYVQAWSMTLTVLEEVQTL